MTTMQSITIRRARRDDVRAIVVMLADDPLGRARERLEEPLPDSYLAAFARLDTDPNIRLVVAEEGGTVVGCLQLCVMPGLSSHGASRGLIEDVRVASHRRSRGMAKSWCNGQLPRLAPESANWSTCSPITPASTRSASMSGWGLRRAMSA